MPFFVVVPHFGLGLDQALKGSILDSFRQSSLVFPSGMVWVCAVLVKVKQSPVQDF